MAKLVKTFSVSLLAAMATTTLAQAEGDAEKGKTVFKKCLACHDVVPGKVKVGPSLNGIVGRKAGTVEGFKYSPAMVAYGVTWDESTLDTYLTKPKSVVPGTKMVFVGLPKDADRADVIAYLKTLTPAQ